jgi:molecular chaperone GrpE
VSHREKEAAEKGSTSKLQQKLDEADDSLSEDEVLEHPSYLAIQQKLTDSEEKAGQHWERLLRQQADIDNAQRRAERDVSNAHKYALEKFIPELLPVIDSMERSLEISSEEHSVKPVLEGISLTLKMFYAAIEKFGVVQINPAGQVFNPELHQAVSVQIDPAVKSGTVISVLQKGYSLNNRLIRPALVVVAK